MLRVWDTAHNNGILIYVLLADRAVEIIADRGVHAVAPPGNWEAICRQIESAYRLGRYAAGTLAAIEAVAKTLQLHDLATSARPNELPDAPVLL